MTHETTYNAAKIKTLEETSVTLHHMTCDGPGCEEQAHWQTPPYGTDAGRTWFSLFFPIVPFIPAKTFHHIDCLRRWALLDIPPEEA